MARALVIEDKDSLRDLVVRVLIDAGHEATGAADGEEGLRRFAESPCDVVVTDLKLPGMDGLAVVAGVKELDPRAEVVVLTAFGTIESAVEAMRRGAFDFVTKPVDNDRLALLVARAAERRRLVTENLVLRQHAPHSFGAPELVGGAPPFRQAVALARKVAPSDATVLLTGESGTGKELFARLIHHGGPRSSGPFVAVNCAAIPEALLESELFGHEKGAFTGAAARKLGRVELAHGGTLFLDEVGEMPSSVQAKVLRFLQDKSFERVGGGRMLRADVRVVAATNRDLAAAVRSGVMREDVFYRLNVFPVRVPALRERREDIPLLVTHFVGRLAASDRRGPRRVSARTIRLLKAYDWPGNVRELENVVERAMILSDGPELDFSPSDLSGIRTETTAGPVGALRETSRRAAGEAERSAIRRALEASDGNRGRAASALKVSRKTLFNRMKSLGMS